MPDKPKLSKLQQQAVDLTSAWDERQRLFNELRNLNHDDERRQQNLTDYLAASRHLDEVRKGLEKK